MTDASRETVRFDDLQWISPVETIDDLPDVDGEKPLLCYVKAEDSVYQVVNGIWVKGADISAQ